MFRILDSILRTCLPAVISTKIGRHVLNIICSQPNISDTLHHFTLHQPCRLFYDRFENTHLLDALIDAQKRFKANAIFYLATDTDLELAACEKIREPSEIVVTEGRVCCVICGFQSDEKMEKFIRQIKNMQDVYYYCAQKHRPPARYFDRNDIAKKVLVEDSLLNKAMYDLADFENLLQVVENTKNLEGDYVEIGTFQGRSAHVVLNYMKQAKIHKKAYLFDTFAGFTYSNAESSSDAIWLNTHQETSIEKVKEFLIEFDNVIVYKLNVITDPLPAELTKISACNIDVDMYDPIAIALQKISPLIEIGGMIVIEDQGHTPGLGGAYVAAVEFSESELGQNFFSFDLISGQRILVRIR